jgi:hypothetical protein
MAEETWASDKPKLRDVFSMKPRLQALFSKLEVIPAKDYRWFLEEPDRLRIGLGKARASRAGFLDRLSDHARF